MCQNEVRIVLFEYMKNIPHAFEAYLLCFSRADRKHLIFDLVNLNNSAVWYENPNQRNETFERLEVTAMRQLERDVVIVCYDSKPITHPHPI